jgi:hypothetical protein
VTALLRRLRWLLSGWYSSEPTADVDYPHKKYPRDAVPMAELRRLNRATTHVRPPLAPTDNEIHAPVVVHASWGLLVEDLGRASETTRTYRFHVTANGVHGSHFADEPSGGWADYAIEPFILERSYGVRLLRSGTTVGEWRNAY